MSSPDGRRLTPLDALPPGLPSMWRLCCVGFQHEPMLMAAAFVLALLAALPDALLALWLKLLGDGVLNDDAGLSRLAAVGLGISATATWLLRTVSTRVQRKFRDKVTIALESHVARLQATVSTIAHQERPEYLDRLAVLRDQVFVLDHMYMAVFLDLRLAAAVGRHHRAASLHSPGARSLRGLGIAHRVDFGVAACRRAPDGGTRRAGPTSSCTSVPDSFHLVAPSVKGG